MTALNPVRILFDSHCVLCSGMTRFVLRHEAKPVAQFISTQSNTGQQLAEQHGFSIEDLDRTFLVITNNKVHARSDGAIALTRLLRAPWRWAAPVLSIIPKALRDPAYDWLARNRYRVAGRAESCILLPANQHGRFILK